jgi:hypothetical protein
MNTKTAENTKQDVAEGNSSTTTEAESKPKYDKEELLAIFDELIFSGEYVEDKEFRNGKLKVSFRSRSVEDTSEISKDVEAKDFKLITTMQEHRAILNLAYSLVKYAGTDWSKVPVEDRIVRIKKLPGPVASLLSEELNKFDQKIFVACQEGEANF